MLKPTDSIYKTIEREMKKISKLKKVFDVGTSQRFAKEMSYFRHLFGKNYQALGCNPEMIYGEDNCDLSGDIQNLSLKDKFANAIICLEVIEHVTDPQKAISELYRILKPKGTVLLTTPFILPFHGKGKSLKNFSHATYPDFWRFTHQGLQLLFKDFSKVRVIPFTSTVEHYVESFFSLFKLSFLYEKLVKQFIINLSSKKPGCATHHHLVIAIK